MKRIISAILFLCVLTSALSVGVFAANDATEMQGVLNKVKSKISIPSEYSDFEYSKSDDRWYFTDVYKRQGTHTPSCFPCM